MLFHVLLSCWDFGAHKASLEHQLVEVHYDFNGFRDNFDGDFVVENHTFAINLEQLFQFLGIGVVEIFHRIGNVV